jgi:hypothetical protein
VLYACQKVLRLLEYASLPCISIVKLYVHTSNFGGGPSDRLWAGQLIESLEKRRSLK